MNVKPSENWWADEAFQDQLTVLLTRDVVTLRKCGALLDADDFRPLQGMKSGRSRWLVAERALDYFGKYREPLGRLLRVDVLEHAARIHLGAGQIGDLQNYLQALERLRPTAPDALVEKVLRYKSGRMKAAALEEMVDLQATGQLSDERWEEISKRALSARNGNLQLVNFSRTVENRIVRRSKQALRIPWTFIDPLDSMIQCIGPGQSGLVIAPWKRGKSQFLLWLAVAYAFQRLNVLYLTLEDPLNVCEDRLDAIITHVPIKSLAGSPEVIRRRFAYFRQMMRNITLYDGTGGGVTIGRVEHILDGCRSEGNIIDAVIIDYDKHLVPTRRYKDRRFEYEEIYNGFNQLLGRRGLIGWTAAQTQRETRELKILSGDKVAEDIGKMQNVTCALSLGKGDWTEDAIYLWVAAHKTDRMEIGCEIVPDLERMLIYDRDATLREARSHAEPV